MTKNRPGWRRAVGLCHHRAKLTVVAIASWLLLTAAVTIGEPASADQITWVGKPYVINGVRYVPRADPDYDDYGVASWYGPGFHGNLTANGEIFDMHALTAAHRTLPFGTQVKVTNLRSGKSVVLTINDRGPFVEGRLIDVSRRAASLLGIHKAGIAPVRVEVVESSGA
jgi:rare lipoprotein A